MRKFVETAGWRMLLPALLLAFSMNACSDDDGTDGPDPLSACAGAEDVAACEASVNGNEDFFKADCADDDSSCITTAWFSQTVSDNPHSKFPAQLSLSFKQLSLGEGEEAQETLGELVSADNVPETYTHGLASLVVLFDSLGPLLDLAAGAAPGAAGIAPQATDLRSTLRTVTGSLTAELEEIAANMDLILEADEGVAYVRVPSLPIDFDPSVLSGDLPADLEVDLNGEWDRVEMHLFGALGHGLVTLIDFLLTHNLSLDIGGVLDISTSAGVAGLLTGDPDFLKLDDTDGLMSSSVKPGLTRVLSILVGTESGGPGASGLLATIEAELAADTNQDDDVIGFISDDAQAGRGDKISISAIKQLADQVEEIEESDSELEIDISRGTWVGLTELGRELVTNIGAGEDADPVVLNTHLSSGDANAPKLWEDLQRMAEEGDYPALEDLDMQVGISPGPYLASPVSLRNLFPAVVTASVVENEGDENQKTVVVEDFALECEVGYSAEAWADPVDSGTDDDNVPAGELKEDSLIRIICGPTSGDDDHTGAMLLKRIYFNDSTETVDVDGTPDFDHFQGLAFGISPTAATSAGQLYADTEAQLLDPAVAEFSFFTELNDDDSVNEDGTLDATDLEVLADGRMPVNHADDTDTNLDILVHFLLQDPSVAGGLYLDVEDASGGVELSTQQLVNDFAAKLWLTYGDNIFALVEDVDAE